jgi:hypothetical protein
MFAAADFQLDRVPPSGTAVEIAIVLRLFNATAYCATFVPFLMHRDSANQLLL